MTLNLAIDLRLAEQFDANEMTELVRQALLVGLDEACNEVSAMVGRRLSLDCLEVDLGRLYWPLQAIELRTRCYEAVSAALTVVRAGQAHVGNSDWGLDVGWESSKRLLPVERFLLTGVFSGPLRHVEPLQELNGLLQQAPERFCRLLLDDLCGAQVCERLALQFSDAELFGVLNFLGRRDTRRLQQLLTALFNRAPQLPVHAGSVGRERLRQDFWCRIMIETVNNRQVCERVFWRAVITGLAEDWSCSAAVLINSLPLGLARGMADSEGDAENSQMGSQVTSPRLLDTQRKHPGAEGLPHQVLIEPTVPAIWGRTEGMAREPLGADPDLAQLRQQLDGVLKSLHWGEEQIMPFCQSAQSQALRSGDQSRFYQAVLDVLSNGLAVDLEAIADEIGTEPLNESESTVPAALQSMLGTERERLSAAPDLAQLRQQLDGVLKSLHWGEEQIMQFCQSAQSQALRSGDQSRFYQAVLDVLSNDLEVDLEAIADQLRADPVILDRHLAAAHDTMESAHSIQPDDAAARSPLSARFNGGHAPSGVASEVAANSHDSLALVPLSLRSLEQAAHQARQQIASVLAWRGDVSAVSPLMQGLDNYASRSFDTVAFYAQALTCLLADQVIDLEALERTVRRRSPERLARRQRMTRSAGEVSPGQEMQCHIANAGLVLATPFLPHLFAQLQWLNEGRFVSMEAQRSAVHVLQYLVAGDSDTWEHELLLNKVLVGWPMAVPISRHYDISAAESAAVNGLLQAIKQHWSDLKGTSPATLRQSFLQREGRMMSESGAWRLAVAPKPFDMLLDKLPWSITPVKHRWMREPIHVQWRRE